MRLKHEPRPNRIRKKHQSEKRRKGPFRGRKGHEKKKKTVGEESEGTLFGL